MMDWFLGNDTGQALTTGAENTSSHPQWPLSGTDALVVPGVQVKDRADLPMLKALWWLPVTATPKLPERGNAPFNK